MLDFSNNISICQQCIHRQQTPCKGACICTVDRVDIIVHARLGICPHALLNITEPPKWPVWATKIAKLKRPQDAGVGDTFKRLLGRFGERFKSLAKRLGMPCGCVERQAEWNAIYSYGDKP